MKLKNVMEQHKIIIFLIGIGLLFVYAHLPGQNDPDHYLDQYQSQDQEQSLDIRLPNLITAEQAKEKLALYGDEVLLLDVRTLDEFKSGHIPGAVLLPHDLIFYYISEIAPYKDQVILIYCRAGSRSAAAALLLAVLGYEHVYDFGGIIGWPGALAQ